MDIYTEVKALGVEIDSHESDLYIPVTEQTTALVCRHLAQGGTASSFVSQIDGKLWYDIPFHYAPWWDARLGQLRTKE